MDDATAKIIEKRARRAIATILGFKDREMDLPDDVNDRFRKVVMDQVNELAHLSIDCLNSVSDAKATNQLYWDLLQEIRDELVGE